jgi:hypothetical protein
MMRLATLLLPLRVFHCFWGLTLTALLFACAAEDRELPAVTIKIMEPKAHVRRAGTFRPDFVARIFDLDPRSLQVFERLSQYCHASSVYSSASNKLNFVFRNEYFKPLKGGF